MIYSEEVGQSSKMITDYHSLKKLAVISLSVGSFKEVLLAYGDDLKAEIQNSTNVYDELTKGTDGLPQGREEGESKAGSMNENGNSRVSVQESSLQSSTEEVVFSS